MAKNIKVRISLPTQAELQKQLESLLTKAKNANIPLDVDKTKLIKSMDDMYKEIEKIKTQLATIGDVGIKNGGLGKTKQDLESIEKELIKISKYDLLEKGNTTANGNIVSTYVKIRDELGNIIKLTEQNGVVTKTILDPIEKMAQAEQKVTEAIYKSNDALDVKKMKLQEVLNGLYSRGNISESTLNSTGLDSMISNLNLGSSSVEYEKINQILREQLTVEKDIVSAKQQTQRETATIIAEQLKLKDAEDRITESIYKSNDALDVKKMKLQEVLNGLYSRGNISESQLNSTGLDSMISNLNLGSNGTELEKINQILREQLTIEKDVISAKQQEQREIANTITEQLKLKDTEERYIETIYRANDALDVKKMKLQSALDGLYSRGNISENALNSTGLDSMISGLNLASSGVEFEKINQLLSEQLSIEKNIISVKQQEQKETANAISQQLKLNENTEKVKQQYLQQLNVIEKQNQAFLKSSSGSGMKTQLEDIRKELNNLKPDSIESLNKSTQNFKNSIGNLKTNISTMGKEWSLATQNTNSFSGAMSEALKKVGLFSASYMIINKIRTSIREGIEAVKEMDSAVTTLKITMDGMTDTGLQSMVKQSQELATSLSSTTSEVLKIVKVFANANETVETIMNKASGATILSNLAGMDSSETAKIILSTTNQFAEMADASESDIMRVADSITAVSRALKLDFADGVAGAGEAVQILGSLSDQIGMSFEETLAVVSASVEKTQMTFSEVATAQKTIDFVA